MENDYKKYFKGYMYLNYDIEIDSSKFPDMVKNTMAELDRLYYETDDWVSYDAMCDALLTNAKVALMNGRITYRDFSLLEEKYDLVGG